MGSTLEKGERWDLGGNSPVWDSAHWIWLVRWTCLQQLNENTGKESYVFGFVFFLGGGEGKKSSSGQGKKTAEIREEGVYGKSPWIKTRSGKAVTFVAVNALKDCLTPKYGCESLLMIWEAVVWEILNLEQERGAARYAVCFGAPSDHLGKACIEWQKGTKFSWDAWLRNVTVFSSVNWHLLGTFWHIVQRLFSWLCVFYFWTWKTCIFPLRVRFVVL